ncbi:uncharacterized protein LOC118184044 [Stegodyphus dumicola]|uniref:uncharacterized protein LOC118184044 n=1 Tax=Stegodyphus dumicola TaxID=202533 RepID=UPI0015AC9FF0|nr:uncharacterized protein LOC118184044 [Stegodyphus dumicola]
MNSLVIIFAIALVYCASADRQVYSGKWKQASQTGYDAAYYPYYGQYGAGTGSYGYDANYKYSQDRYATYPIDSQRFYLPGGVYRPHDYADSFKYGYKPYTYDTSYKYYDNSAKRYVKTPYDISSY